MNKEAFIFIIIITLIIVIGNKYIMGKIAEIEDSFNVQHKTIIDKYK